MSKNPKTAKGKRRLYEISCVCWLDLLGYGSMLAEASFDPTDAKAQIAIKRLFDFHEEASKHAHRYFPIHAINDGIVVYRDLSPRTKSVTFDFLDRAIKFYQSINEFDKQSGFPGARMIISVGFRVRKDNKNGFENHPQMKRIKERLQTKKMTVDEAVNEAFYTKPHFGLIPELQANFAFTKSYLVDAGGSKEGFGGPNCFIDLSLFESTLPKWITFDEKISWEKMGMKSVFGKLSCYKFNEAYAAQQKGVLDAFEIAKNISTKMEIVQDLTRSTIKKRG